MKKVVFISALFLFSFIIYSCTGPAGPAGKDGKDGGYDKQIRIDIESAGNTGDDFWHSNLALIKFDKRNYVGVDSIIFVANIYTDDTAIYGIAELFNYDDGSTIQNSTLQSNSPYNSNIFTQSENIFQSLPAKEINLGIRTKSSVSGKSMGLGRHYLFLYRK
jgi:hypothetical protein